MAEDRIEIPIETLALLTKKLYKLLEDVIGDEDTLDILKPLIPAVVNIAANEGFGLVENMLVGIGQDKDTYPYWDRLIEHSTPDVRIMLMEQARQMAVRDRLKKIQQDEMRWNMMKLVLKTFISILPLLL